jgi:hypothetical protein
LHSPDQQATKSCASFSVTWWVPGPNWHCALSQFET